VVATKNSMETEGVWRMPEAQIDRFHALHGTHVSDEAGEIELLEKTTGEQRVELATVLDGPRASHAEDSPAFVPVVPAVKELAWSIVRLSRPDEGTAPVGSGRSFRLGASPRAARA